MVVGYIPLHERRGCLGISTSPVLADDDLTRRNYCLGFAESVTLSFSPAGASGEMSPQSFWSLLTIVEAKHGCCGVDRANGRPGENKYCGGGCGGKISRLSRFTSVHRFSVCS